MRGDEKRVVDVFCTWLKNEGWLVEREVDFVDVVARRGDDILRAEAKGRTTSLGLDTDTLYGQLLRRMPNEDFDLICYGVVVPEEGRAAALRVDPRVRKLLNITIFVVQLDGTVQVI